MFQVVEVTRCQGFLIGHLGISFHHNKLQDKIGGHTAIQHKLYVCRYKLLNALLSLTDSTDEVWAKQSSYTQLQHPSV